jgi:hypothetical protein
MDLNYYANIPLTFTDDRNPQIIFDRTTPVNQTITVGTGLPHNAPNGIEILEIVKPNILNTYIELNLTLVPGATAAWPFIPPGCIASNPSTGIYRLENIDTAEQWDLVKNPIVYMPANQPDDFIYAYSIKYEPNQNKSWGVLVRLGVVVNANANFGMLTSPTFFAQNNADLEAEFDFDIAYDRYKSLRSDMYSNIQVSSIIGKLQIVPSSLEVSTDFDSLIGRIRIIPSDIESEFVSNFVAGPYRWGGRGSFNTDFNLTSLIGVTRNFEGSLGVQAGTNLITVIYRLGQAGSGNLTALGLPDVTRDNIALSIPNTNTILVSSRQQLQFEQLTYNSETQVWNSDQVFNMTFNVSTTTYFGQLVAVSADANTMIAFGRSSDNSSPIQVATYRKAAGSWGYLNNTFPNKGRLLDAYVNDNGTFMVVSSRTAATFYTRSITTQSWTLARTIDYGTLTNTGKHATRSSVTAVGTQVYIHRAGINWDTGLFFSEVLEYSNSGATLVRTVTLDTPVAVYSDGTSNITVLDNNNTMVVVNYVSGLGDLLIYKKVANNWQLEYRKDGVVQAGATYGDLGGLSTTRARLWVDPRGDRIIWTNANTPKFLYRVSKFSDTWVDDTKVYLEQDLGEQERLNTPQAVIGTKDFVLAIYNKDFRFYSYIPDVVVRANLDSSIFVNTLGNYTTNATAESSSEFTIFARPSARGEAIIPTLAQVAVSGNLVNPTGDAVITSYIPATGTANSMPDFQIGTYGFQLAGQGDYALVPRLPNVLQIYNRNAASFFLQHTITPNTTTFTSIQGQINSTGDLVLVNHEDSSNTNWVRFYRRSGTTWTNESSIPVANIQTHPRSVMDPTGTYVSLAGTPLQSGLDSGPWISKVTSTGSPLGFAYLQQLKSGNTVLSPIHISRNADTIIARNPDTITQLHIFKKTGNDVWTEDYVFNPGQFLLRDVLSADGETYAFFKSNAATLFIMRRVGNTWVETQIGNTAISGNSSIAVSQYGDNILVGTPNSVVNLLGGVTKYGRVRKYSFTGTTWNYVDMYYENTDNGTNIGYGAGVAVSDKGNRILVGSPTRTTNYGPNSGSIWHYTA